MTAEPRIAICVVTFNSAPLIDALVESLPSGAAGTDWTLVVADNASSDGTVARVRAAAPDAVVVETGGNLGYAGGVNAAVAAAGEQDAYLILNADVRLDPGCIKVLYDAIEPGVGLVVPQLRDGDDELIWSMRREPSLARAWADALIGGERAGRIGTLGEIVADEALYGDVTFPDWAEGSTQLMSHECWVACGPWDSSYFLYSEETDFDLRARDAGLRTKYEPVAKAVHLEGGSAESPRLWALLSVNKVRLYRSRHGAIPSAFFWAAIVVREGSRALLGKRTSRAALRDLLSPRRMRERPGPEWLAGVRVPA